MFHFMVILTKKTPLFQSVVHIYENDNNILSFIYNFTKVAVKQTFRKIIHIKYVLGKIIIYFYNNKNLLNPKRSRYRLPDLALKEIGRFTLNDLIKWKRVLSHPFSPKTKSIFKVPSERH